MAAEYTTEEDGVLFQRLADIEKAMADLGRAIDQVIFIRDNRIITGTDPTTYHEAFADTPDATKAQKLAYMQLLESLTGQVRAGGTAAVRKPFVSLEKQL